MSVDYAIVNITRCLFTKSEGINYSDVFGMYRSTISIQQSNFTNNSAVHNGGVFVVWLLWRGAYLMTMLLLMMEVS